MNTTATPLQSPAAYSDQFDHNFKFSSVHFGLSDIREENEDSNSIASCQLRGWGRDESRTWYSCLTSLVTEDAVAPRQIQSQPLVGEGWGYFVDTRDSNHNHVPHNNPS